MFLGLTADEFWQLTPRHWDAVWNQYLDSEERQDRRIGMLYTMYYNAHRPEHSQAMKLDEMFPARNSKRIQRVTTTGKALRDPMDQLAMAREFTKVYHGGSR